MRRGYFLFLIALGLACSAASAQPAPQKEAERTVYRKKTVIDFSTMNIEGRLIGPSGSYVKTKKKARFKSLIELRGNFRPELMDSVSEL